MTMITPSYLGETIEYSSLHACRSTLEDPTDAGDDVLREFAVRIRKSIRGIDLACRYGGEEFVIVMPETDLHVAGMVAERLRRSIAGEPFAVNKGTNRIEVTISIGLSTLEQKGEAVADVLKRADTALYRAKHDGRNRVVAQAA